MLVCTIVNSVVEWLEDRPKHMLKVDDRELKVDFKSYSNPVREKVGGEIAVRGFVSVESPSF